jgi:hypothetical protein
MLTAPMAAAALQQQPHVRLQHYVAATSLALQQQ